MNDAFYVEPTSILGESVHNTISEAEIAEALEGAMNDALWSEVKRHTSSRADNLNLNIEDEILFAREHLSALPNVFKRILRGWWEEKWVRGDLRAGPCNADQIALLVLGLAVLQHLGYQLARPNDDSSLGILGEIEVRGLALTHCSHIDERDGRRRGVDLREYADRLLEKMAVVLLADDDMSYYRTLAYTPFVSAGSEPRIDKPLNPALILSALSLILMFSRGAQVARAWIDQQRSSLNQECAEAFEAARQRWSEQDVA